MPGNQLSSIAHIVVLMLENRSFDSMLGWLYPDRPDFDGLTGRETNCWHRNGSTVTVPVWNDLGMSRTEARGPEPAPGELFDDIEAQLWGPTSRLERLEVRAVLPTTTGSPVGYG